MPQQFLYWPAQEYHVRRLVLVPGEQPEAFYAHRGYAVGCLTAGACRLELDGRALLADGGSMVLLGPDVPYKLQAAGSAGAALLLAEFSAACLQPLAAALPGCDLSAFLAAEPARLLCGLPGPTQRDVRFLLEKQLALCAQPQPLSAAAAAEGRLLLAALLLELTGVSDTCYRHGSSGQLAEAVQRYIAVHYAEKLDLDALAARFHTSRWHLCHVFKAGTGQSPIRYLDRTRVQAACGLLHGEADLPLEEIARRCGYSGAAQLRRSFREALGQSPRQYRRAVRG